MDQPEYSPSSAGTPPTSRRELRGPRPTPLCVSKDSHKIKKKPPVAPQHNSHAPPPPHRPAVEAESHPQQPMIIYTVSPKVIHASVSDFMLVVQRLTGTASSSGGAVSPAARLASIEMMRSPTERDRDRDRAVDVMMGIREEGVDVGAGRIPGILTPAPASLPTISPAMFSPATDPITFSQLHDLSPFLPWNNFLCSPSTLYSAPLVSPVQSLDLFNHFLDF